MITKSMTAQSWAHRLGVLLLAVLLTGVGQGAAVAEPSEAEQQARRLFESAEGHFRNGLFAEALAKYQAGYDLAPLPGFLINIAQCHRRLGNLSVASATYRKFIMVAPDSPFVPQVKSLIAELDALKQDLGETNLAEQPEPSKSEVAMDGESALPTPAPPAPAAELVATPSATANAEPHKTRWWLWGGIGAVVVAGVATAVLLSTSSGTTTVHDGSLGTLRR